MHFRIIKKSFFFSTILFLTIFVWSGPPDRLKSEAKQDQPSAEAQSSSSTLFEQHRRNIGPFLNKLRAGKDVTVAYIGGSVTAGVGTNNPEKNSYRALVTDWLRKNFPRSAIAEINGGIAHTGSLYATLRARRDVIADKPDLVFVDLASC